MKFILHEIKLWFKDKTFNPKSYHFLPNKVNVITGESSTGKSTFLNIIDYCLLSDQVKIATTIADAVEWFGINFSIDNKNLYIARKSLNNGVPSIDLFLDRTSFPDKPFKNSNRLEIIKLLDESFNITSALKEKFSISFRDFLLFNSLTENIIAASDSYFDTSYFEKEYPKGDYILKLKQIFKLITGISTLDLIEAQSQFKSIEKYLKNIEDKKNRNKKKDDDYKNNLIELLDECKKNNLLDKSTEYNSINQIYEIIKNILPASGGIENPLISNKINELQNKRSNLESQLLLIQKYRKEWISYRNKMKKSADSLQPIEFLNRNLQEQILYPFETNEFLQNLEKTLNKIKNNNYDYSIFPDKLEKKITYINEQIQSIDEEIKHINPDTNMALFEDKNKCFLLGKIQQKLENINKSHKKDHINEDKLAKKISTKEELYKKLKLNENLKLNVINQLNKSIQYFYNLLDSIPIYRNFETKFDFDEMSLKLYPPHDMFPIGNLGSKSNFMFMHLYLYLGLHDYLLSVNTSYVPQFLFIDQPSIPYYQGKDDNLKLSDAFYILNKFIDLTVNKKHSDFQIFMVEHAAKSNWEDVFEHFHTVDEFINGKALVPQKLIKND